jgi:hypothetical protein
VAALDTETNDAGLRAGRGSAWPWGDGYVCGISLALDQESTCDTYRLEVGMMPIVVKMRASVTFELNFWGQSFAVGIGYYPDGQIGEVFVSADKIGGQIEALARDAAILISLALQFGAPLETIQRALTRCARGEPASLAAAVVDLVMEARA